MSEMPLSILVVDDDESMRDSIASTLESRGFDCVTAGSPLRGLSLAAEGAFDLVLCDLKMPELDGIAFTRKCLEIKPEAAIVIMTAFGSIDLAVQALRAGAYDYISKPFRAEELLLLIKKIEEKLRLQRENAELKSVIQQKYSFANIVAHSESMHEIFETVKRLSQYNTTVLITGESGTGKELLAKAIHHNSQRRGRPFVAVNCGAIPEHLIESELFGHKKGAFTDAVRDKKGLFEEADGGTIFLDEIGELPTHLQVKLLRALQEMNIRRVGDEGQVPIDVRVVAATHRDLDADVVSGRFREDLFYRLNVVSIHIPPLRERVEDIPVLIEHFIEKHAKRLSIPSQRVSSEAMKAILRCAWKGNIRELENCIERAMVLSESGQIDLDALPDSVRDAGSAPSAKELSDDNLSIKEHTRNVEIALILKALKKTKGNRTHAAKVLEISHRALLYKLKEYGLSGAGKN